MNNEVAVDPIVASHVAELRLLLSKVGFYEGRFISRFPKRWLALALGGIVDQNMRKSVQVLLDRVKDGAFLPSGRSYDSARRWIDNAIDQHKSQPFSEVITDEKLEGCINIDAFDVDQLKGSRDIKVVPNSENMLSALDPLLSLSGSLFLIDPYFVPWASVTRRLFVDLLLRCFSARCVSFTAFVSEKEWRNEFIDADKRIREILPTSLGGTRELRIVVLGDLATSDQLHARYLFSERGGVRLDRGLQTGRARVDLSLIDRVVHNDLMHTFVERPLPYPIIKEFRFQI